MKRKLGPTFLLSSIIFALAACSSVTTKSSPNSSSSEFSSNESSSIENSSSDSSSSSEASSSSSVISSSESSSSSSEASSSSSSSSNSSSSSSSSSASSSSSSSSSSSASSSSSETSSSSSSSSASSSSSSSTSSSSSSSSSSSESSSSSSASSSSSSSSSITPVEPLEPVYAGFTYKDYQTNNIYKPSYTPHDNAKVLVIPVWFSNSNTFIAVENKDVVREDIRTAYFGTNEETGWRSVKTFYEEESQGTLTLEGTVSEWYEITSKHSTYGSGTTGGQKTSLLVKTATKWYFDNHPEETRKDYDCDGDGFLDGVMLIYGAPDYTGFWGSDMSNLWAYTSWTQSGSNHNNPNVNAFFWASYDFMYGSNIAASHTGLSSSAGYATGDTRFVNIDSHTFIHEMGHMFGLDDYYDYEGKYVPAGGFSMQDQNVGGHDPFSSFALGWGQAYIPTESITINLKPFTSSGEMIILSSSWNEYNSPYDEYLVLEYFTADGLNELDTTYTYGGSSPFGTKTPGIRLWHVDARLGYWTGYDSSNNLTFEYAGTTNPLDVTQDINTMVSNSYHGNNKDCNLLQLVRNSKTASYNNKTKLKAEYLFREGESFDMETYKSQFVNSGKLNNNKTLGFSFTVDSVQSEYITVTVTKA